MDKYTLMAHTCLALHESWVSLNKDEKYKNFIINNIRVLIFEVPMTRSGKRSIQTFNNGCRNTLEHYYTRIDSANKIFNHIEAGRFNKRNINRFVNFIKSRSRVHMITKKEHAVLTKIQKEHGGFHWKRHYEMAGIELINYNVQITKKYVYNIDNMVYNSSNDIAMSVGLSRRTIQRRCDNDKFKNYNRVLI